MSPTDGDVPGEDWGNKVCSRQDGRAKTRAEPVNRKTQAGPLNRKTQAGPFNRKKQNNSG